MGTQMAPTFTNIFMGKLERNILHQATHKPTVWWRFIDDIFAVWTHGEDKLIKFIDDVDGYHRTIKFTSEWSRESVTFLDTRITRDGYRLVTDLHTKPTDTHHYLHRQSCHTSHCKTSIAYCQALRLQRICSKPTDYERHVEELKGYLVKRGYDGQLVQQQIDKATNITREELLTSQPKKLAI